MFAVAKQRRRRKYNLKQNRQINTKDPLVYANVKNNQTMNCNKLEVTELLQRQIDLAFPDKVKEENNKTWFEI